MRRRFLKMLVVGCASVSVVLAIVGTLSLWRFDEVGFGADGMTEWSITSVAGGITIRHTQRYELRRGEAITGKFETDTTGFRLFVPHRQFKFKGSFQEFRMRNLIKFRANHFDLVGYGFGGPTNWQKNYVIAFPHYAPALVLSVPLITWMLKRHRRKQRLQSNQCLTCGYDLRASKEICPECGTRFVA